MINKNLTNFSLCLLLIIFSTSLKAGTYIILNCPTKIFGSLYYTNPKKVSSLWHTGLNPKQFEKKIPLVKSNIVKGKIVRCGYKLTKKHTRYIKSKVYGSCKKLKRKHFYRCDL